MTAWTECHNDFCIFLVIVCSLRIFVLSTTTASTTTEDIGTIIVWLFVVLYWLATAYHGCLLDNDRFLYSFIKPRLPVTTCVHMSDHGLLASCFWGIFYLAFGVIEHCILSYASFWRCSAVHLNDILVFECSVKWDKSGYDWEILCQNVTLFVFDTVYEFRTTLRYHLKDVVKLYSLIQHLPHSLWELRG